MVYLPDAFWQAFALPTKKSVNNFLTDLDPGHIFDSFTSS